MWVDFFVIARALRLTCIRTAHYDDAEAIQTFYAPPGVVSLIFPFEKCVLTTLRTVKLSSTEHASEEVLRYC